MIRNIDGKIIKEGKLRTALRGVVQTGTYVESLDGSSIQQESILNSIKSVSPNNDTSEIFGEPSSFVNVAKIGCIHELRNPEIVEGAAVALPLEAVEAAFERVKTDKGDKPYQLHVSEMVFAMCGQQQMPSTSMNLVDAYSISNSPPHVGDVPDSRDTSLPSQQMQSATPTPTDYIGHIQAIKRVRTSGDATTNRIQRRTIDIQNLSGNIIGHTLWNEMATDFDLPEYESMEKPVVITVSSCWVTRYNGSDDALLMCGVEYVRKNLEKATVS
ncbi:nucleic acid-binding, OB-fold protein [Tanacetum coccineum]